MVRSAGIAASSVVLLALVACSSESADDCTRGAPSLTLDVVVSPTRAPGSLVLELGAFGTRWTRTFDVGSLPTSGPATVRLGFENPTPAGPFTLDLTARSYAGAGGAGVMLEEAHTTLALTADACNHASLTLGPASGDAGPRDSGQTDSAPLDSGMVELDGGVPEADAGPADDAAPTMDGDVAPDAEPTLDAMPVLDAEPSLDATPAIDATPTRDAEPAPDAQPVDTGVEGTTDSGVPPSMDAGVIDGGPFGGPDAGGIVLFPYTPSNTTFTQIIGFGPTVRIDCGETVFDSSSLQAMNPCSNTNLQPTVIMQPNGTELVSIATGDFTVASGSRLRIVGARPVQILVYGTAQVNGEIDASASTITSAGVAINPSCTTGAGGAGGSRVTGGGGGGGGFQTDGARGGGNALGDLPGDPGPANGNAELVPLRTGCPGGHGGNMGGGGSGIGGGALQISAASELRVEGNIFAAGGGGQGGEIGAGGGGGGSGGAILLEGTIVRVRANAIISVHGGGGGEGGGPTLGRAQSGGDGTLLGPGHGGDAPNAGGGPGGDGAGNGSPGSGQRSSLGGGGGGGGSAGRIRVNASMSCELVGQLQPNASSNGARGCP